MSIGKNIARLRKEKGLTQRELGEMLGVSNQAVSKWESEITSPDVSVFPSLADVFECSIDEIFEYIPKKERVNINILPSGSSKEMEKYLSRQIKFQLDESGSTNKLLQIMSENLSGEFELTEENVERLLDAYRELYLGMLKKKS